MTSVPEPQPNAPEALKRLLDGNRRFAEGHAEHPHDDPVRRLEVTGGQHPIAVVLCCADSRVIPELIFDQGIGDIFVVRVAGNILDEAILGSIEYAVGHLGVQLVLVVGHSGCGAVSAALTGDETMDHIDELVRAIRPAVEAARASGGDLLTEAIRKNALLVAEALRTSEPVLPRTLAAGRLRVLAAHYHLESGEVELLEPF